MKHLFCLAALTLIPAFAMAQKTFDDEVNSELDKMYVQKKVSAAVPAPVAPVQVAQQAPIIETVVPQQIQATQVQPQVVPAAQPQPIYTQTVYAQPAAPAPVIQKQPTTLVEASPLTESRADKMRKAREETELQTEQKIVEKLEISRMDDEKRRAEVLFGDKFSTLANPAAPAQLVVAPAPVAQAPVAPIPVVQAPVVVPVAAPVVVQEVTAPAAKVEKLDRDAVRQEISAALDESKAKEEAKKAERKGYFSLLGGMDNYNNNNIKPQYAFGFGFGQKINDRMLVEGQFNYADAHVQQMDGFVNSYGVVYPRITDMQAYQGALEAKYEILGGMFRPLIGGTAAYTYRKYNDIQFGTPNNTGTSHAIDVGILAGADVTVSDSLALGFEVRYLWNIANQTQANNSLTPAYSTSANATTPENMGYLNMSLVGRMSF